MALPYPEGKVFFKRSILKNNGNGLDPDNLTSFNSHALIEWCWNDTVTSSGFARNRMCHMSGKHNEKDQYAYWEAMVVSFGTKDGFEKHLDQGTAHGSRHADIKRVVKTMLPDDTDEYEKRARGGPVMTAVTPIKLHPDQPYMYIDLNVSIRAVYFPLAQKPSTVFPDLCSYLMVDFRMGQGVQMYDVVEQDKLELLRIKGMKKEEAEALELIENTKITALKKRLEENHEAYLQCRDWSVNENGHRVKDVKFDHCRGLANLPECKCTALNTSLVMPWLAISLKKASDLS
jgi:hypothetical protein